MTQALAPSRAFSNGMPTYLFFKNGHSCVHCDCVTEHTERKGVRVCSVCGTVTFRVTEKQLLRKKELERKRSFVRHAFLQSICNYIRDTEIAAFEACLRKDSRVAIKWRLLHTHVFDSNKKEIDL